MRLREFQGNTKRTPSVIATALEGSLGKLVRIGGSNRFYQVGQGGYLSAIYSIAGTEKAFALAWERSAAAAGVTSVYVWNQFSIYHVPDFELPLPITIDISEAIPAIASFIKNPHTGTINESLQITEGARVTDAEFAQMAQQMFPTRANKLTSADIAAIAQKFNAQVPASLLPDPNNKDATFDLSGGAPVAQKPAMPQNAQEPEVTDPHTQDMLNLAKVKTARKMAASGNLVLMARKPGGDAYFQVPGLEEMTIQLERMLTKQLGSSGGSQMTMEDQYEMLRDKVKLVAGGQSANISSLLITGAPRSGKSFNVTQTLVEEMGLVEGKDYAVTKGRVSVKSLYRTLIENINGLIIFDDADEVVSDPNGINILKGALDTGTTREVSYDVRGMINTKTLTKPQRDDTVNAVSRILNNRPVDGDLQRFERLLKKKTPSKKQATPPPTEDDDDDFDLYPREEEPELAPEDMSLMQEIQDYFNDHLPNKIDFQGRIIFISNLDITDWDSAIVERAFYVNMKFTSGEMLDYIDKVKTHMKSNLTEPEKQEVMDYLRDLYVTGKFVRQINFGVVQQAFDLRLLPNWKKMVNIM